VQAYLLGKQLPKRMNPKTEYVFNLMSAICRSQRLNGATLKVRLWVEVKKNGVPVLARKQSFLSLSSRRHQRVLSARSGHEIECPTGLLGKMMA
jgi:hypothetical protein